MRIADRQTVEGGRERLLVSQAVLEGENTAEITVRELSSDRLRVECLDGDDREVRGRRWLRRDVGVDVALHTPGDPKTVGLDRLDVGRTADDRHVRGAGEEPGEEAPEAAGADDADPH